MSGNERWIRKVFRWCWNGCRVDALTTLSGSAFQMEEAAAGRARLPTVESGRRQDQTIDGGWNRECRRRVWAVPGTAARYREELGNPTRRPCSVCAPVAAANERWRARQWCGRSTSGGRPAVPPRSAPTDSSWLKVKVKVKVHTLDIAPLRSESPQQKRSGMARVLNGFHSFTYTSTRLSATVVTRNSKNRRRKSVGASNH